MELLCNAGDKESQKMFNWKKIKLMPKVLLSYPVINRLYKCWTELVFVLQNKTQLLRWWKFFFFFFLTSFISVFLCQRRTRLRSYSVWSGGWWRGLAASSLCHHKRLSSCQGISFDPPLLEFHSSVCVTSTSCALSYEATALSLSNVLQVDKWERRFFFSLYGS